MNIIEQLLKSVEWIIRENIGKRLFVENAGAVIGGPFAGMKLLHENSWSGHQDLAPYILGTYEQHLTPFMLGTSENPLPKWDLFVDIGAAAGFWAIGMKYIEMAERVIAYEQSPALQQQLKLGANLNQLEIEIKGSFSSHSSFRISTDQKECLNVLILCDIEGGEYEIFDDDLLKQFEKATLVIELHSYDPETNLKFSRKFANTHNIEIITRNLWSMGYEIPNSVKSLRETAKLILFSEGRGKSQEWLIAHPKN
jgi:hypothetical protein